MAQEIEKKFLVSTDDYKALASKKSYIKQGYISTVPARSVRIRIRDNAGYITIKGIGDTSGAARFEWEKMISIAEAEDLLEICEPGIIEKTRYEVNYDGHLIEVDEFSGANTGLVIAEIELNDKDEHFSKPAWLGAEVTGNAKYYNSMLSKKSFKR